MSNYSIGRGAERKVVQDLRHKGFRRVRLSPGSRGPADITARKNGRRYFVQVKANSARMDSRGRARLRGLARARRGVAVSIHRENGTNHWRYHGNWTRRRR